jgi:tight adherence protein C
MNSINSIISADAAEIWLAVAVIAVILTGSRLWRIAQREEGQRLRLEAFRGAIRTDTQLGRPPSPWYWRLGILIAPIIGADEQQRLLKQLARAGFKSRSGLASFIAMRVSCAIVLTGLAWLLIEWRHLFAGMMIARLLMLGATLLGGWRLPDFILSRIVKRRRLRLEQGMPDALDLLVICAESGLSLNQSVDEISRQLRLSNKDVADEFSMTSAEMQVLADFGQALDNLVERTGLPDLRSLVATLKQSLKFGTPLAESLRSIALEMRAARQARMEERAARLPVLLALPMVLFILPCVVMIVGTPVAIRIMDVFKNMSIGAP